MRHLALVFVVALLVTACGGGEELSEQILEDSIGGDANVEISEDGDDVTINVESDEGSFSIGSGGEVPEELTVPLPDGGDVIASTVVGESASVTVNYPNDRYEEIVGFYDSWTSGSGDTWLASESAFDQGDGQTVRNKSWQGEETATFIAVRDCYSIDSSFEGPFDAACVSIAEN